MLETKELCKSYKPKKGVKVQAVDHISVRFPEKGMVFLLGKSGSGKSTMLNLLGGLDSYDDGEIIIKGISSKDFSQQRFDSYRNTYVGFIFQEYNVLEEFSVGANIALAIELQGKKAEDEQINRILKEVDLEGFGNRNPNELSGGQKQRVAIARALVKNPEIIMADEPTGALDSNTGRQILDTLKKLSKDKLVIIVSHDREYAEQYADRIIELADGKIVRDVQAASESETEERGLVFRTNTVEIPGDYHLTEDDRVRINEYIDRVKHGLTLTVESSGRKFNDTVESDIPEYKGNDFALIKSKLPMKSAFRIGKSSLGYKKFKLVITILLSVTAFSLFTMVDTFSSYDHIRSCVDSLADTGIDYISLGKQEKYTDMDMEWWYDVPGGLEEEDLSLIESQTGLDVTGIYSSGDYDSLNLLENIDTSDYKYKRTDLTNLCGYAEITKESLESMGYSVYAGNLPDGSKNEVALSLKAADLFVKNGYVKAEPVKDSFVPDFNNNEEKPAVVKISEPHFLIGKYLLLDNELYKVTAIIDTKFSSERFARLDEERNSAADFLVNMILEREFDYDVNYSLTGAAMVGPGKIDKLLESREAIYNIAGDRSVFIHTDLSAVDDGNAFYFSNSVAHLDDISKDEIIWTGKPVDKLSDNEMIITLDSLEIANGRTGIISGHSSSSEEITQEALNKKLRELAECGELVTDISGNRNEDDRHLDNIRIVGCFKADSRYAKRNVTAFSDSITDLLTGSSYGIYKCAVGAMPEKKSDMETLVRYCYREDSDYRFSLNNAVTFELDTFDSIIKELSTVFFWIGVFFAVFAAILMANFISVSISYKKQEIGILRAIGSRSMDVFRIFFSESFIIAVIEFVLTSGLCAAAVMTVNSAVRNRLGVLITLLHFGPRQMLLTLVISVAVAFAASFIPVQRIASKKPIDAIRNK